jgi:hypothetical protein
MYYLLINQGMFSKIMGTKINLSLGNLERLELIKSFK